MQAESLPHRVPLDPGEQDRGGREGHGERGEQVSGRGQEKEGSARTMPLSVDHAIFFGVDTPG